MSFGNGTETQRQFRFDCEIKCNELCDECNQNKKDINFYLQSVSYYRNKAGSHYYFCSKECKDKYENTKMCKYCHYNQDLKELNGCMYCTDNPNEDMSCYQREVGDYGCDYCHETRNCYENTCYKICSPEWESTWMCGICYEPYKNIVYDKYDYDLRKKLKNHNNWVKIIHDNGKELLSLINKDSKFICNLCKNIKLTSGGIFIVDEQNLCCDCEDKFGDE
jgi:hypothetical protein